MRPPLPLLLCISSPQATTSSQSTITDLQLTTVQLNSHPKHHRSDLTEITTERMIKVL